MRLARLAAPAALTLALLAAPPAAEAQQPASILQIGFLMRVPLSVMSARTEAFRQGLRR
jgi:hypothetical protein